MKNTFFLLSKYTYFFEIGKEPQGTLAKLLSLLAHLSPRKEPPFCFVLKWTI